MNKKIGLLKLFWIFFKIGMVLFGGGYAILPFLKSEIVEKEKLCTMEEVTDYYAISQCFPGLVAGNISMLTGYKAGGVAGAFCSVFGVCLPAFLAIAAIFAFLSIVLKYSLVQNIFVVLNAAICVLILLTVLELWKYSVRDKFTVIVFAISLIASFFNVSPFVIVIVAGVSGLVRYVIVSKNSIINESDGEQ